MRFRSYGRGRVVERYASVERTVGRNMEKKVKTYLILCVLFSVLAVLVFALCLFLIVKMDGPEMESTDVFAFLSALLFVLAFLMNKRRNTAKLLVSVIEQIEARERIEIEELSFSPIAVESKLVIVQKLLDCGNLRNYEIIAGKVIARRSLHLTEEKLRAEEEAFRQQREAEAGKCPYCGQGVGSSVFCPYCGRRLRQE